MTNAERLAALVITFVVSLALGLLVDPPWSWALLGVTVLLVCIGADQILHYHWRARAHRRRYAMTAWSLPALATVAAFLFLRLPLFYSGVGMGLGLAAAAGLLTLIIVSQYRALDPTDPLCRPARLILSLVAYLLALGLYSAIYAPKVRSLLSAPAVAVVSILLALEVLRQGDVETRRVALIAGVIGVVLAEMTWSLNYCVVSDLVGGAILLLAFYYLVGLSQHYLAGELNGRLAVELGSVAALGLCLIFVLSTIP